MKLERKARWAARWASATRRGLGSIPVTLGSCGEGTGKGQSKTASKPKAPVYIATENLRQGL